MISTFKELIASGDEIKFEDISPDLMTLTIKIRGEQFDSSITGEVAKAIGAFQSALYRAAAEMLHNSPNIRTLSAEEKELFEIVVKVSPGCSEYTIPGEKFLPPLLRQAIRKMDSKHICIVICFGIASFTGYSVGELVADAHKNDQDAEATIELAKTLTAPLNSAIQLAAEATAKAAKNADSVDFGERTFKREEIERLNARSFRQEAHVDTYSATCRVTGIHKDGSLLKVDLVEQGSNESFTAKLPPPGLFGERLPEKTADVANLIDVGALVVVTILVKETKARTERLLISWQEVSENEGGLVTDKR